MQSFVLRELLLHASVSFQLKIKEALYSSWENPLLNKQVNHVNLLLSLLNTHCFSIINVFPSTLHSHCYSM